MAEENTDIPVAVETNESEGSQEESSDIAVIAVAEISESGSLTEEGIDIPVNVEINELEATDVKVTRATNTLRSRPKILPRYLLPSLGSCHDLCKYGMGLSFGGKPEIPMLRKVKSTGGDGRDSRRITISLTKQTKHAISRKLSPDDNTQSSINSDELKGEIISSQKIVTRSPRASLRPSKEVEVAVVRCSGTKLNSSQSKGSSPAGYGCPRTKRDKEFGEAEEQDGGRCREINISMVEDKKALVSPAVSCTPKKHVKRVANVDKNITGRCRLRNQSHPIKIKPVQSNNEEVQEKTFYVIEPSTEKVGSAQNDVQITDLSPPQSSSATDKSLKHDQEVDRAPKVPTLSMKKNVRRARPGIRSNVTSPSLSWGFTGLRHKKLGTVSTQSSPSSPLLSTSRSDPIHSKHESPTSGNEAGKSEYSKVEHKSRPRRRGISDSENRDVHSRRLKFRKGRVVDLQPVNNTPRRLKFRRVRLLGETQNSRTDLRKRNVQGKEANHSDDEAKGTVNNASGQQDQEFKRKKIFRRKETIDGKSAASRIKSIVLRHQDSKEKKEIQNLFNNVIEETASKLAQTRQSKVKALVGAFETVISLQDTRPSATISA